MNVIGTLQKKPPGKMQLGRPRRRWISRKFVVRTAGWWNRIQRGLWYRRR